MNQLYCIKLLQDISPQHSPIILKIFPKKGRKILKAFLLGCLYQLFCGLFQSKLQCNENNFPMECYEMDSKIIQILIQGIIETGEYTLEGIAFYTRVPFDVIYEAACGINNQFSIVLWAKVVDLYMQVKPEMSQLLIDSLLKIIEKNRAALSSLLSDSIKA